ncbi:MAG: hypothetical protein ACK52S_21125 [Pirellula sp.]
MRISTAVGLSTLVWACFFASWNKAAIGSPKTTHSPMTDSSDSPTEARATTAGSNAEEVEPSEEQDAVVPAPMKGTTTVSGFKIQLEGVGSLGDISESVTRFRPKLESQNSATSSVNNFSFNQFPNGQTFSNGNGAAGGAVGGSGNAFAGGGGQAFAGGGGASAGSTFIKPNFGIALKVTQEDTNAKKGKNSTEKKRFAELGSAVKIVELDGSVEEAKDTGPITTAWPLFDRRFPGTSGLYIYRRKGIEVPLKEIHGELKISTGRRLEAVFQGARPQKKKADGEEFAIKSIEEGKDGLTVVASFPPTTAMKKARDMQEKIQAMMSSNRACELEIEDSDGKIYIPTGAFSSGGAAGSFQGFSFNGNTQTRSSQTPSPEPLTISFRFQPIQAYSIKSLKARLVEPEGEPEVVPFTIEVQTE